MRMQQAARPVAQPRQRVVRALVRGILRAFTRTHLADARRRRALGRLDPDQRVREVGEW